jgi:hypothetical protein
MRGVSTEEPTVAPREIGLKSGAGKKKKPSQTLFYIEQRWA